MDISMVWESTSLHMQTFNKMYHDYKVGCNIHFISITSNCTFQKVDRKADTHILLPINKAEAVCPDLLNRAVRCWYWGLTLTSPVFCSVEDVCSKILYFSLMSKVSGEKINISFMRSYKESGQLILLSYSYKAALLVTGNKWFSCFPFTAKHSGLEQCFLFPRWH